MLRKKITEVLVEQIHANRQQPRKHFEKMQLEELRDSICQFGILQPLILRREEDGSYMILAGERRFRAAVMAGLTKVPALVREASEEEAGMIALVENIQRENLGYIEEAKAYQTLMETYNIPQQELARKLGKNQSTISNKIRILNLPEDIQHLLVEHRLTERHARALLKLDDAQTGDRKSDPAPVQCEADRETGGGMSCTKRKAGKRKEEDNEDQLQAVYQYFKKDF